MFDVFNLNLGQKIGNMNEKWDHLFNPAQGLLNNKNKLLNNRYLGLLNALFKNRRFSKK